jgi:cytochrome c
MRRVTLSMAICAMLGCLLLSGCDLGRRRRFEEAARRTHGDPHRGRAAILRYGCQHCHTIPGIREAHGLIGPPLGGVASRAYLAGELPNSPDNMAQWIQHPRSVEPHTVMPEMNVTPDDSRDITAYLYTLR